MERRQKYNGMQMKQDQYLEQDLAQRSTQCASYDKFVWNIWQRFGRVNCKKVYGPVYTGNLCYSRGDHTISMTTLRSVGVPQVWPGKLLNMPWETVSSFLLNSKNGYKICCYLFWAGQKQFIIQINRSSKNISSCEWICPQSCRCSARFFVISSMARYSIFRRLSSEGNNVLDFVTFRSCRLNPSMVFVVQIKRRSALGYSHISP